MDKAKFRSMFKCVLVLAVIALCSGLLLGAFNILTYVDPLQSTYERFAADTGATFSKMTDEDGKAYGDGSVVYYAVSDDGVYHAFLAEGKGGYGGNVQLYVYVKDGKIDKIVMGENSETFLNKLDEAKFYANFIGKEVAALDVLGTDVVSGATKSSTAVKNAVNAAVQYFIDGNNQEVQTQALHGNLAEGGENNG